MECIDDAYAEAFVRGELSPEAAAVLREHLETCAICEMRVSMAQEPSDETQAEEGEGANDTPDTESGPSVEEAELQKGTSLGRYLVLERLGAGGMGVVYLAYDPELDRRVAIKLMRARSTDTTTASQGQGRLLREAQAMARISHPNVIAVHDVGVFNDRVFAAMEWVDGSDLHKHLHKNLAQAKHSWREVLQLFISAGRGLAAAHSSGMVHRDFKPDNVLIGKDGRVRVTDFGLARMSALDPAKERLTFEDAHREGSSSRETQPGHVAGTPGYMSPEQYLGVVPDARSDQFSFCVALYEGLYGERPFTDELVRAAATHLSKIDGKTGSTPSLVREPPKGTAVPSWLRKRVIRGLRIAPEERYESMDALLDALSKDPARTRRNGLLAAAALMGVATLVAAGLRFKHQQDQRCRGAVAQLAGLWDEPSREQIRGAFFATGKSYAETAWTQVRSVLDGHTEAWVAMNTHACEATHVHGTQSAQLLDLRMACLGRRLSEVEALANVFRKADGQIVEHAVQAASSLTPLDGCADVEALTARIRPPEDLVLRGKVEALRKRMDEAKALEDSGKYTEGIAIAERGATDARALAYRPVQAEVYYRWGQLNVMAGYGKEAEKALSEAMWLGEAAGYEEIVARAVTSMVFAVGYHQGRHEDALEYGHRARASLEATQDKGHLTAHLHNNLGAVYLAKNDLPRAIDEYSKGLSIRERILRPTDPDIAISLLNLGEAYLKSGEDQKCQESLTRAIALTEQVLGQHHPIVGFALNYLGVLQTRQKRYAEALATLQRAEPILSTSLGDQTHYFASFRSDLAHTYEGLAQHAEAQKQLEAMIKILQETGGPAAPELGPALERLSKVKAAQGDQAGAASALQQAKAAVARAKNDAD